VAGAAPIEAHVSVYDNWIGFGAFTPTEGSSDSPAPVIAKMSPARSFIPTTGLGVDDYDVAYIQVNAPRQLNLSVRMNGHMKLCTPTGQAFADGEPKDTRKQTPGPYELSTQYKVAFYGKFLDKPDNSAYISPTTNTPTDFKTWTGWGTESGWLSPSNTDAWTGDAKAGTPTLDMLVERGQYTGSITGGPAAIAIIERVLRRGQQDVEGNYRQVIDVTLTYAE
jgi:hypothetical protein